MHTSNDEQGSEYKVLSEALRGIVSSQYELAVILEEERDLELAGAWYRKAALQGHAAAAFRAGMLCLKDSRWEAEAAYWLEKAAAAGHQDAQYNLGLLYECGRGVAVDPSQSLRWHRIAAQQGHAEARAKLEQLNNWFDVPGFGN